MRLAVYALVTLAFPSLARAEDDVPALSSGPVAAADAFASAGSVKAPELVQPISAGSRAALESADSPAAWPRLYDGQSARADAATPVRNTSVVRGYVSSEFHSKDPGWFSPEWSKTDPGWRYKLTRQPNLRATAGDVAGDAPTTIRIDPAVTYQSVTGIGTSLDETSCYAMQKGRSDRQIKKILRRLIDPRKGTGYSLFRIAFGTSDFSDARSVSKNPKGWYAYQDDKGGPFSIDKDKRLGVIRVIKLAQQVAAESGTTLRFVATPWSPPAWMKTPREGSVRDESGLVGGRLGPDHGNDPVYARYAEYLRKAVQAYAAEGIPIYAVTVSNEHYFTPDDYPGCYISPEGEAHIVEELGKQFREHGLSTRVWIHDHNWDLEASGPEAVLGQLKDPAAFPPQAYQSADATAFHGYAGSPADMSRLHDKFPDKDIQFTEGSVWGVKGAARVVDIFRNWSKSYLSWVSMAPHPPSEHIQGPYNGSPALDPTLLVTDAKGRWRETPEYYLIGQVSRFVRPGAVRIESSAGSADTVTNVAFKNPDGTLVLVVVNQTAAEQPFVALFAGRRFKATVAAASVATYVFR